MPLFIRNDCDFRVRGFRDSRAARGTYLNAATTATWEVRTAASPGGSQVSSGTLTYVTASNGEYVGGMDDSVSLTAGTEYWVHIILVEGGVRFDYEDSFVAVGRKGKTPVS